MPAERPLLDGQSRQPGRLARHIERAAAVVRAMPAYRARCRHEWRYIGTSSQWSGYIESCRKCGEIHQVPQ